MTFELSTAVDNFLWTYNRK